MRQQAAQGRAGGKEGRDAGRVVANTQLCRGTTCKTSRPAGGRLVWLPMFNANQPQLVLTAPSCISFQHSAAKAYEQINQHEESRQEEGQVARATMICKHWIDGDTAV